MWKEFSIPLLLMFSEISGMVAPPLTPPSLIGGTLDAHGCVSDGGYQWCDSTQSCDRPWISPCPLSEPLPEPIATCSEVMCMMYCEHGNVLDSNGCPLCLCKEGH